jgi:magnesium transporter
MIHAYLSVNGRCARLVIGDDDSLPAGLLWIDLFEPSERERSLVERSFAITLPSYEEMQEIEQSSRFYVENEARYMTATVLAKADTPVPGSFPITFILARRTLITLRQADPRPFHSYATRLMRLSPMPPSGDEVLVGLLEAFVQRIADILERIGGNMDGLSRAIFRDPRPGDGPRPDLQAVVRDLGRNEELASLARETLVSLGRVVRFMAPGVPEAGDKKSFRDRRALARTLASDIISLSEQADFESHKVNFLLDATLGMINIEQSRIIKLFSVVATVFLPPTLVASIYGMNFEIMPELKWAMGYPWALLLMLLSAILPIIYFRRKGWF